MMIDEDLPDLSLCSICVPRQRQQLCINIHLAFTGCVRVIRGFQVAVMDR